MECEQMRQQASRRTILHEAAGLRGCSRTCSKTMCGTKTAARGMSIAHGIPPHRPACQTNIRV